MERTAEIHLISGLVAPCRPASCCWRAMLSLSV